MHKRYNNVKVNTEINKKQKSQQRKRSTFARRKPTSEGVRGHQKKLQIMKTLSEEQRERLAEINEAEKEASELRLLSIMAIEQHFDALYNSLTLFWKISNYEEGDRRTETLLEVNNIMENAQTELKRLEDYERETIELCEMENDGE